MSLTAMAAFTAAILSAISAFLSREAARSASSISARRGLVNSDFKEISRHLYSVVAFSVKALNSGTDENFDESIKKANDAAERLNILRIEHRITLAPVFDAIWHLNSTPIQISQFRNDRSNQRAKRVIERATALRRQIDKGISIIYFHGYEPSLIYKLNLRYKCSAAKRTFESR